MLPWTWKAEVSKRLYNFYIKYRGRKIDEHLISELENLKKQFPYKEIPKEWIEDGLYEYFGERN